jgi:alkylation response protein AidB-like acyl-CoA dehydrogenase
MDMENRKTAKRQGGAFVIRETRWNDVFIPEDFNEEQRMIEQTCIEFLKSSILPKLDQIDALEPGLMEQLLDQAGELGLLGVGVPEEYGGFGKDFTTTMLVTDAIGGGHSFAVALSAHTGIGTLPIQYYGNASQKQAYLPKLATGEWKAAYCLTEPDAGSDANSGKTTAQLNDSGTHYILNGQKMWITNAGFADVFIVFAKIDTDENLSAFIVERNFGGISFNPEEHKLGIKGSSTRQVFFNDCPVPVENLLSERGMGFKIAVNILNVGRIKLGAATLGAARKVTSDSLRYANERVQFGRPISSFGAIRSKLAQMLTRIYAVESATYRAGQDIEWAYQDLIQTGVDASKAKLKATEEFAIECAIIKVWASEMLDYVVDEGVQIYGGMGYSADGPMERAYRDARINRIFEGTNEVNRLLMVDMLLKRALKGQIDLMGPAQQVANELLEIPSFGDEEGGFLCKEKKMVAGLKKAGLLVAGAAVQKLMMTLSKEQEILMNIADILGVVYLAESCLLRVEKRAMQEGESAVIIELDMLKVYVYEAADQVYLAGKECLYGFADGDDLRMLLVGLRRFTKVEPFNLKEARKRIAKNALQLNATS